MRSRQFHISGTGWQTYIGIGLTLVLFPSHGFSQNVRNREEIVRIVTIEKLTVSPDYAVAGEIVNRSPNAMRDVQVIIRHVWLWDQETKPGRDDPSRSVYVTVSGEIAAGGRSPFTHKPSPPLSRMPGGRFITSAAIAGYTEIIPQAR
jgi:hypothetical protein